MSQKDVCGEEVLTEYTYTYDESGNVIAIQGTETTNTEEGISRLTAADMTRDGWGAKKLGRMMKEDNVVGRLKESVGRFGSSSKQVLRSGGGSNPNQITVTDEVIKQVMKNAPLKMQHGSVSKPVIQIYVDRILAGETDIPPIKVDGNIIVDGNHRYIANRITNVEINTMP